MYEFVALHHPIFRPRLGACIHCSSHRLLLGAISQRGRSTVSGGRGAGSPLMWQTHSTEQRRAPAEGTKVRQVRVRKSFDYIGPFCHIIQCDYRNQYLTIHVFVCAVDPHKVFPCLLLSITLDNLQAHCKPLQNKQLKDGWLEEWMVSGITRVLWQQWRLSTHRWQW